MSDSHWIIDQLDAGWATLSPAPNNPVTEEWTLPAQLLPEGLKEGDALTLTLSPAPEVSASLKAEVEAQLSSLSADDDGGDFSI